MIETIHVQLLLATFAGWVGRQQTAVITYLIEENRVLREQVESDGKSLRFTDDQRRRFAAKGKPLGRNVLRQIATIVTPETILAWHRKLVAAKWTYPRKRSDQRTASAAIEIRCSGLHEHVVVPCRFHSPDPIAGRNVVPELTLMAH